MKKNKKNLGIKGYAYIDLSIYVIIAMLVMIFFINVVEICGLKKNLEDFSSELLRTAEIAGGVGEETNERCEELKKNLNFNPNIVWVTNKSKIQLGDEIKLNTSIEGEIGIGGILKIPIKLSSSKTGVSEQYFKELAKED